jgi:hypothetical protein
MNRTLSLSDLQNIKRKMALAVGIPKKDVKLTPKPDFVDLTLERAHRLSLKLKSYLLSTDSF